MVGYTMEKEALLRSPAPDRGAGPRAAAHGGPGRQYCIDVLTQVNSAVAALRAVGLGPPRRPRPSLRSREPRGRRGRRQGRRAPGGRRPVREVGVAMAVERARAGGGPRHRGHDLRLVRQKVERALGEVDGVQAAAVNLATRTATVRSSGAAMDGLVEAVASVGLRGATPRSEPLGGRRGAGVPAPRRCWRPPLTVAMLVMTFAFRTAGRGRCWAPGCSRRRSSSWRAGRSCGRRPARPGTGRRRWTRSWPSGRSRPTRSARGRCWRPPARPARDRQRGALLRHGRGDHHADPHRQDAGGSVRASASDATRAPSSSGARRVLACWTRTGPSAMSPSTTCTRGGRRRARRREGARGRGRP